jgi:hypothetical protein
VRTLLVFIHKRTSETSKERKWSVPATLRVNPTPWVKQTIFCCCEDTRKTYLLALLGYGERQIAWKNKREGKGMQKKGGKKTKV